MKKSTISFLLLTALGAFACAWFSSTKTVQTTLLNSNIKTGPQDAGKGTTIKKTRIHAARAKRFVHGNGYNERFCFLVDMSIYPGHTRFFVYDFEKDTVTDAGLVTHGRCNENWLKGRQYNNTVGCGCTSLGKYRIGNSYMGRFGLAFKLYGLDTTNDNAYRRYVVLHAHDCVPPSEVNNEICQSDGCPTVSPAFLKKLEVIIKTSRKPVLLWIFN